MTSSFTIHNYVGAFLNLDLLLEIQKFLLVFVVIWYNNWKTKSIIAWNKLKLFTNLLKLRNELGIENGTLYNMM